MKIGAISGASASSPWELYENIRRSRAEEQSGGAAVSLTAGDTQESAESKRVSGSEGCETCKNRKYQDGSGDPGVSYKTPTKISADQAASAVRGHEMEHVNREQGKADREGREVLSQSVTYHTAICPECGRSYVSGGTTRTTTREKTQEAYRAGMEGGQGGEEKKGLDRLA